MSKASGDADQLGIDTDASFSKRGGGGVQQVSQEARRNVALAEKKSGSILSESLNVSIVLFSIGEAQEGKRKKKKEKKREGGQERVVKRNPNSRRAIARSCSLSKSVCVCVQFLSNLK